ncbi:unnamed protein product [Moneuplotes crassus]|uniref:Vacuolar protein sorting-associated protein 54 C-terminal domain-containing protein n=1 Tax=Euplotes crassus TaxID=5936 RepID=A0AAD1XXP8_EUPCR|nr:unnamed protein product [Moneuplotes crassus]
MDKSPQEFKESPKDFKGSEETKGSHEEEKKVPEIPKAALIKSQTAPPGEVGGTLAGPEVKDRYFYQEKLKNIPSYASVLNNPKKSNFMQWVYSATGEKILPPEVPEPPKIGDYETYINKMNKSYAKYMKYHQKEYVVSGGKKTIKKADAISAVNRVPDEYFQQDFRLSSGFFNISNKQEATAKIELCEDYLEVVENFLVAHVAENFDFFSQSFNNIRDMEQDMGDIKEAIQEIKAVNNEKRKQIVSNMLGVYFLNRRMTIMKQIRKHLKLIKILHESIPVIKNLIKSGTNFNTVTELIEKCFRLINEKLQPLKVAHILKERINEAEGKSQKKIEEEFRQLLEANFNSSIQFNSCTGDEEVQGQIREFLEGDFRAEVLDHTKFSMIHQSWSFFLLTDKKTVFTKFSFLMKNLLKCGKENEIITQMKSKFTNNSKRFYHLMLDSLMTMIKGKNVSIESKKEVFKHLDAEDILASFFLIYLIFSGVYISLERLSSILFNLCDAMIAEEASPIGKEDDVKSDRSHGHLGVNIDLISEENKTDNLKSPRLLERQSKDNLIKKEVEMKYFKGQVQEVMKSTTDYFVKKIVKSLQIAEPKICTINIEEVIILKHYFNDLANILKNKYDIEVHSIQTAIDNVILGYINNFSKKKTDAMETLLRHEEWKTIQVSPYFQGIISVINDLQIEDQDFLNFDKQGEQEFADHLIVDGTKFQVINSTCEIAKLFYEFIKIIRYFPNVATQVASHLTNLLKVYNVISCEQILGSQAFHSKILERGITAKHLAITYQSLSFILVEVPFLQEQILCRVEDNQDGIKKEFDLIMSDIDNHKTQILNKLSKILCDVIRKSMSEPVPSSYTSGEVIENIESLEASPYIKAISKSMNSLNRVILSTLNEESRKIIFTSVFPTFIDEIDSFVDEHFINDHNEEGFTIFKHDLGFLEKEITDLAKNISTGQAFIHRIGEIQGAELNDFDLESEEEEEEFGA